MKRRSYRNVITTPMTFLWRREGELPHGHKPVLKPRRLNRYCSFQIYSRRRI